MVAVQLLGGLQITGCLACFVLVGMFFASVGCGCSRAVTQVRSSEMKLFAELRGDSLYYSNEQKAKGKKHKGEKRSVSLPGGSLSFLLRILPHCGCCIFFTFKS